jgi:hypothetical protein
MVTLILALVVSSAVQIADPWNKVVIFRLGHFHSLKGPGLFNCKSSLPNGENRVLSSNPLSAIVLDQTVGQINQNTQTSFNEAFSYLLPR